MGHALDSPRTGITLVDKASMTPATEPAATAATVVPW
jgi:hypothetical protein